MDQMLNETAVPGSPIIFLLLRLTCSRSEDCRIIWLL